MSFRQIYIALDGPILDQTSQYYRLYGDLTREYDWPGLSWPQFRSRFQKGLSIQSPRGDTEPDLKQRRLAEEWDRRREWPSGSALDRVWPGVPLTLQAWSRKTALILVARRRSLHQVLGQVEALGLRPFFRAILFSTEPPRGEDGRRPALRGSLPAKPGPRLWVASHPLELRAAKERGFITAAVTSGPFPLTQVLAEKPDQVWSRLSQGIRLLEDPPVGKPRASRRIHPRASATAVAG